MTTARRSRAIIDTERKRRRDKGRRRQVDMDRDQRPEIRVSDADREQTVKLLERHHVDGRLTWEEFSERMEAAFHARTREDLRRTLADLPPLDEPRPPAERRARSRPDWRSLLTPPLVIAALIGLAVGVRGQPAAPRVLPTLPTAVLGVHPQQVRPPAPPLVTPRRRSRIQTSRPDRAAWKGSRSAAKSGRGVSGKPLAGGPGLRLRAWLR